MVPNNSNATEVQSDWNLPYILLVKLSYEKKKKVQLSNYGSTKKKTTQ
jgi:hypothetical protein